MKKNRVSTSAGIQFTAFNPQVASHTNQGLYEIIVNPATGYIRFGAGILARRGTGNLLAVRFYTAKHPETNELVLLARFVPKIEKNTGIYALISKDGKGSLRDTVYARTLFKTLGVTGEKFTCEPLLPEDRKNDVIFQIPS